MSVILKIEIRNATKDNINNVLNLVAEIKAGDPNLLPQIEVAIEC